MYKPGRVRELEHRHIETDLGSILVFRLADQRYLYCPTSIANCLSREKSDYNNYRAKTGTPVSDNPLVKYGKTRIRPLTLGEVRTWLEHRADTGLDRAGTLLALDLDQLAALAFVPVEQPEQPVRLDLVETYKAKRAYFNQKVAESDTWQFSQEAAKERQKLNKVLYREMTSEERSLVEC